MRLSHALPIAAAVTVLAGMAGAALAAQDGGISTEEAQAQAANAVKPLPGKYDSEKELVAFEAANLPENMKGMMRSAMSNAFARDSSFCLTPEDAEKGARGMVDALAESDCTLNKFDVTAGSIDADMTCRNNGGEGHITMVGTMTPESSNMVMTVDQQVPDMGSMLIKVNMKSRRVGECS